MKASCYQLTPKHPALSALANTTTRTRPGKQGSHLNLLCFIIAEIYEPLLWRFKEDFRGLDRIGLIVVVLMSITHVFIGV